MANWREKMLCEADSATRHITWIFHPKNYFCYNGNVPYYTKKASGGFCGFWITPGIDGIAHLDVVRAIATTKQEV